MIYNEIANIVINQWSIDGNLLISLFIWILKISNSFQLYQLLLGSITFMIIYALLLRKIKELWGLSVIIMKLRFSIDEVTNWHWILVCCLSPVESRYFVFLVNVLLFVVDCSLGWSCSSFKSEYTLRYSQHISICSFYKVDLSFV